jgi:hypothetical protein
MERLNRVHRRVNRRVILAVAGWLAAALVATAVGVAAVSLLGEGISDSATRPLSADEVRRALARSTPAPTPSPTGSAARPPAAGPARSFSTAGGTVIAGCAGDQATLSSWSPAQGFHSEDVARGPAPTASLTFESDEEEIHVAVDCASGRPQLRTEADDGHRGRGRGGGNSGSGGDGDGGSGPG